MSHPCGVYSDLFYYKSPRMVGVVVKALEGREERQGLDSRRWSYMCIPQMPNLLNLNESEQGVPLQYSTLTSLPLVIVGCTCTHNCNH